MKGAIEVLDTFSPQTTKTQGSMTALIELLNKDTLKTMQLLGFNYKEAIGQPLTEAGSSAITSKLQLKNSQSKKNKQKQK